MFRALRPLLALSAAALSVAAAPASEPLFVPLFKANFPDPFILPDGQRFIAYSTNDGPNVPMAMSTDLVHWSFVGDPARPGQKRDALPKLGSWAKPGFTWAPEVLQLGGRYLLYYTASDRRKDAQCIGVAVATDPLGPFTDAAPEPLVCQTRIGGSIDANAFRDADGKLYLYFKNDGNRVHARTSLWGQSLSPDGLTVAGEPIQLIRDDQKWEEGVVEAPSMVRGPAGYTMFFSGGFFGWKLEEGGLSPYAMGYASCAGPLGPCRAAAENPVIHSYKVRDLGCLSGPGHQSIFNVAGRSFIGFHAWSASDRCGKQGDSRYLYIAPLYWKDGKPVIGLGLRERR